MLLPAKVQLTTCNNQLLKGLLTAITNNHRFVNIMQSLKQLCMNVVKTRKGPLPRTLTPDLADEISIKLFEERQKQVHVELRRDVEPWPWRYNEFYDRMCLSKIVPYDHDTTFKWFYLFTTLNPGYARCKEHRSCGFIYSTMDVQNNRINAQNQGC